MRIFVLVVIICIITTNAAPTEDKKINKNNDDSSDERITANVEQVPPPSPLITDSAKVGYRMPGLYALGDKPFYLEHNPKTGTIDFTEAVQEKETTRFSAKIPQERHEVEYDDELAESGGDEIDRKDTLGPYTPNDIKSKTPDSKIPLISSSYANYKHQGMGLPKTVSTTSTIPPPIYYNTKTKETVLDLWPEKSSSDSSSSTTSKPSFFEEYDYVEEVPAEKEPEYLYPPKQKQPYGPSSTTEQVYYEEEEEEKEPVRVSEKPVLKEKPQVFGRPYEYEEPFRPIYDTEEKVENVKSTVRPVSTYYELQPPREKIVSKPQPIDPSVFSPPPPPPPQQGRRPQLSIVQQPPLLDSQGWQQASLPPPPPTAPSSKVTFPDDSDEDIYTTTAQFVNNYPIKQNLPQGYEPKKPIRPVLRPEEILPPQIVRRPIERIPRPPPQVRPDERPIQGPPRRSDTRYQVPNSYRPNVLPQFRPNVRYVPQQHQANRRHQQNPGYFNNFYPPPPPPPPVGRRVGPQVTTLQMIQNGGYARPVARDDTPHPNPRPPVSNYEVRMAENTASSAAPPPLPPQQLTQSSEEKPVFIVYANTDAKQSSDIHVGTHGEHKPVPPSRLSSDEPVLTIRPSNNPSKSDFPYALEKPTTENPIEKDEGINIIPNLQDYLPSGLKQQQHVEVKPDRKRVVVEPASNKNEFTVSAIMHTDSQQVAGAGTSGGVGTGSVMIVSPVSPQHRHPVEINNKPNVDAEVEHESFNFQPPFHPSANVAPAAANGWTVVKGSAIAESVRPGLVDRVDVLERQPSAPSSTQKETNFDIENFQPKLEGGFQPIFSFPEKTEEKQETKDRQE